MRIQMAIITVSSLLEVYFSTKWGLHGYTVRRLTALHTILATVSLVQIIWNLEPTDSLKTRAQPFAYGVLMFCVQSVMLRLPWGVLAFQAGIILSGALAAPHSDLLCYIQSEPQGLTYVIAWLMSFIGVFAYAEYCQRDDFRESYALHSQEGGGCSSGTDNTGAIGTGSGFSKLAQDWPGIQSGVCELLLGTQLMMKQEAPDEVAYTMVMVDECKGSKDSDSPDTVSSRSTAESNAESFDFAESLAESLGDVSPELSGSSMEDQSDTVMTTLPTEFFTGSLIELSEGSWDGSLIEFSEGSWDSTIQKPEIKKRKLDPSIQSNSNWTVDPQHLFAIEGNRSFINPRKRKECIIPGCHKGQRGGNGLCISHGGGTKCSAQDCSKTAKQGGRCKAHGGGRRCVVEGCIKSAQEQNRCVAHGGGRHCSSEGCKKLVKSMGLCISHGGGTRCSFDGCDNSAQARGLCKGHGPHGRRHAAGKI